MKKSLVIACMLSVGMLSSVQAVEVKKPNLSTLKNAATSAVKQSTAETSKAVQEFRSNYQKKINDVSVAFNNAQPVDYNARLALAQFLYDNTLEEGQAKVNVSDEIKKLQSQGVVKLGKKTEFKKEGEDNSKVLTNNEILNALIVQKLTDETFVSTYGEWDKAKKDALYNLEKKVIAADNKYKNLSLLISAPLKKLVDGEVGVLGCKDELKSAASLMMKIEKKTWQQL